MSHAAANSVDPALRQGQIVSKLITFHEARDHERTFSGTVCPSSHVILVRIQICLKFKV